MVLPTDPAPQAEARPAARERKTACRFTGRFLEWFAAWTLGCNLTVLCGGSLRHAIGLGAAGTVVLVVLWARSSLRRGRREEGRPGAGPPSPAPGEGAGPGIAWRLAATGAALALAFDFAVTRDARRFWLAALFLMLVLALREVTLEAAWSPPAVPRRAPRRLALLCCTAVLVTLVAQRPNPDDAIYVHIAVAAADHPEAPLLAADTLHGLPGPSPILEFYRAQSCELLQGALALLTGIPAIDVAHLVLPILWALLVPLAWARLFRHLLPERWFWAVLAVVIFLLTSGDTERGFGNFGFVRLHQGKAVFLSAGVPLLMACALEFALAPGAGSWIRLAAAQVASVGLTSSALWLAPGISGMTLLAALIRRPRGVRTLLIGGASSAYLVLLGLLLRRGLDGSLLRYRQRQEELFSSALSDVLGNGPVAILVLCCLLGSWALCRSSLTRRLAVLFALGFLALPWNPFLSQVLAEHVTGVSTYWRVFWLLPVPLFVALVLTAPLEWFAGPPSGRRTAGLVTALLAAGLLLLAPRIQTLSAENGVRLAWPARKVPRPAFDAAAALVEEVRPGSTTLAPVEVAPWIPTLRRHPFPLVVRPLYLKLLERSLGADEVELRQRLALVVSSGSRTADPRTVEPGLSSAIELYRLESVCLDSGAECAAEVRRALRNAGFERVRTSSAFEIWCARR